MKFAALLFSLLFLNGFPMRQYPSSSYPKSTYTFKRNNDNESDNSLSKTSTSPKAVEQGNSKEMIRKSVKRAKDKCQGDKECLKIAEKLESDFVLLIDKLRKEDVENEQECLRCTLKNLVKLYEIDEHLESEEEDNGNEGVHYKKA